MIVKIIFLFLRVLAYAVILAWVYAIVAFDATRDWYYEESLTEIVQELTLLVMAIVSFIVAGRYHPYRVFNRLLGVIALLSLIREFNNFLGHHLYDGAWQTGVLFVLVGAAPYFGRRFRSLMREVRIVSTSYAFGILLIGGLVLHVFSRLYGLSNLWINIMGDNYLRRVARVSEESIELLAYVIVFIGICELGLLTKAASRAIGAEHEYRKELV